MMERWLALLGDGAGLTFETVALLCGVSAVGSLLTAALGLGGGLLVLAVFSLALPPPVLIPIHGVVQLGSNLGRTLVMWRQLVRPLVLPFLLGAMLGAALGGRVVVDLPTWLLQTILALFILFSTWGPKLQGRAVGRGSFAVLGMVSTFATLFVGATGPLVAPFVAAACADRRQVVATHAALMTLQHGFKVLAFVILGFSFAPYLWLLAALVLCGFLGTLLGKRLLNRLPEQAFRLILKLLITLLALRLLWRAGTVFFLR